MGKLGFKFDNARTLVDEALSLDYFSDEDPAIPYVWKPGKTTNPLVVVTGENAGGKSFFRRCVSAVCQDVKIECIGISMEARRTINYNPWLLFVYGDEQYDATGINSINTVLQGIKTCQSRDKPHVIVWDEPDVGLSEGNAASVGKAIAEFTQAAPAHTLASIVVTHRKALVQELQENDPHYLYLGGKGPATVAKWLAAPPVIRPLEEVREDARNRFKAIEKILKRVKEKKSKSG